MARIKDQKKLDSIAVVLPMSESDHKLLYYQCIQCKNPYFGGLSDCESNEETKEGYQPLKPEDIKCQTCRLDAKVASQQKCSVHGREYLEYKCKYCCKQADFLCANGIHYCVKCHDNWAKVQPAPCLGFEQCPLKGFHPPNGIEYYYGCAMCRTDLETKDYQQ